MNDLEQLLSALAKPKPHPKWAAETKERLLRQMKGAQEEQRVFAWFQQAGPVFPASVFVQQAKRRLMAQMAASKNRWSFWETAGLGRFFASALVLVLAVFTTLFFTEGKSTVRAEDSPLLQVLWGEVKVQDHLEWRPVTDWMQVKEGDLLRTGPEVDAILHFNENQLRLGPNTVLLVTQLNAHGEMRFDMSQGQVWLQVPSQKEAKGFVSIKTSSADILTPNASVLVDAEPLGGATQVRVFDGVTRVSRVDPVTQEIEVQVLEPYRELTLVNKTSSMAPTSFSLESLAEDRSIQTHLNRDRLHEKHLEEVKLERLKKSLLKAR